MKKKVVIVPIILAMIVSATGCSNVSSNDEGGKETSVIEKTQGVNESDVCAKLKDTYNYCEIQMTNMQTAWNFANDAKNGKIKGGTDAIANAVENAWGCSEDQLVEAFYNGCGITRKDLSKYNGNEKDESKGLNYLTISGYLMEPIVTIKVTRSLYDILNPGTDLSADVEMIKEYVQSMSGEEKTYDMIKNYYLMIKEMKTWIDEPDGNLVTLSNNISEYKKKAEGFNSELELYIK